MKKFFLLLFFLVALAACNSELIKPDTHDQELPVEERKLQCDPGIEERPWLQDSTGIMIDTTYVTVIVQLGG